jgi:hypothetical protein
MNRAIRPEQILRGADELWVLAEQEEQGSWSSACCAMTLIVLTGDSVEHGARETLAAPCAPAEPAHRGPAQKW